MNLFSRKKVISLLLPSFLIFLKEANPYLYKEGRWGWLRQNGKKRLLNVLAKNYGQRKKLVTDHTLCHSPESKVLKARRQVEVKFLLSWGRCSIRVQMNLRSLLEKERELCELDSCAADEIARVDDITRTTGVLLRLVSLFRIKYQGNLPC